MYETAIFMGSVSMLTRGPGSGSMNRRKNSGNHIVFSANASAF